LQRTGSFKFRGAWNRVACLTEAEAARGVLAYSSGNHAQGVALAARLRGAKAVIVMPADAPSVKIDATREYGAEIVLYDRAGGEDRDAIGAARAARDGLTLIRPFDDPWVIAGQGTVGLEIAAQAREAGATQADVLVCCGGGGLTAGVALALEADAPGLRARPAEPAAFDDVKRSLEAGERRGNPPGAASICDAILTDGPGEITFPVLKRLCGPGVAVSDDEALGGDGGGLPRAEDRAGARRGRGAGGGAARRRRGRRGDRRRLGRQRDGGDVPARARLTLESAPACADDAGGRRRRPACLTPRMQPVISRVRHSRATRVRAPNQVDGSCGSASSAARSSRPPAAPRAWSSGAPPFRSSPTS
jgi:hypothetical protein